ncbi:MAG: glycosyltransferase family 4 protein [Candidatus Kerfeldbacteria bacterium]|nr:glycosyltransferase family 4 protein [Candidatus Kerfeldbacteria bacterium]
MIRVGIDSQIADVSSAGIGQFTAALVHWLPRVDTKAEYVLLRPAGRQRDFSMPGRWWWDQVVVPNRAKGQRLDVVLKPSFSVPIRSSVPTVVVLHDLAARLFPEQLNRPSAWFYGRWAPWTLRFARLIIAVSEFTAGEATKLLGIPSHRIRVVHESGDHLATPRPQSYDDEVMNKFSLAEQFILHVGTIEPRKNLAFLVRTFAEFWKTRTSYQLVLAGAEGWKSRQVHDTVRELKLGQTVRFLGKISDDERRALYRRARALVLPSLYEGFGRPVLEAMASGTPVVAAKASAIPEVAGKAGLLVDGFSVAAWVDALKIAAADERRRAELRAVGFEQSRRFSWERTARQIAEILHEVADD